MTRQRRLKLLDKNDELRPEVDPEYNYGTYGQGDLEEWIEERIPPPPPVQLCEAQDCVARQRDLLPEEAAERELALVADEAGLLTPAPAMSYTGVVTDGHVCFTYVCWDCSESMSDYYELEVGDYPTTDAGYAIAPTHCK